MTKKLIVRLQAIFIAFVQTNVCILSIMTSWGGSGKRLWPLSNDIRSKQFIQLFKDDNGNYESMVQRVYRQITTVDPEANVTIATSKTQVSAIHNQLGEKVSVCAGIIQHKHSNSAVTTHTKIY